MYSWTKANYKTYTGFSNFVDHSCKLLITVMKKYFISTLNT